MCVRKGGTLSKKGLINTVSLMPLEIQASYDGELPKKENGWLRKALPSLLHLTSKQISLGGLDPRGLGYSAILGGN